MRVAFYVLRRVVTLVPQLFFISVATFILVRLLPGNPARLELGPLASAHAVAVLRHQMKLDRSLPVQYVAYLGDIVHGNFGTSWTRGTAVASDLATRIPITLSLIIYGLVFVMLFLVPLAIFTASPGGGLVRRALKRVAFVYGLLAGALPDFWLGLVLIFLFYVKIHALPGPDGLLSTLAKPPPRITGVYTIDAFITGRFATFADAAAHMFLPVVTLAFVYGAPVFKMLQSSMARALESDYTSYSQALGIPDLKVLVYALRNAAAPSLVMAGVVSSYLIGGAVLIETVFNLHGLGQYAVDSIKSVDYAPIQAFVLVAAVFTVFVYLIVDLLYFAVDPRVQRRMA
jgi:ABC-type dipeptide/oligopeptide/nickel transport system permease component